MRHFLLLLVFFGLGSFALAQLGGPKGSPVPFSLLNQKPGWETRKPKWDTDTEAGIASLKQKGTPFYLVVSSQEVATTIENDFNESFPYTLPTGKMLLAFWVGRRGTATSIVLDKLEETATTLEIYYHEQDESPIHATYGYPVVLLELPLSTKPLQFRRVPYTKQGEKIELNYRKAEGIVFTEYLPKQEEVSFGDDNR
jgi:hypothetical protein